MEITTPMFEEEPPSPPVDPANDVDYTAPDYDPADDGDSALNQGISDH